MHFRNETYSVSDRHRNVIATSRDGIDKKTEIFVIGAVGSDCQSCLGKTETRSLDAAQLNENGRDSHHVRFKYQDSFSSRWT